MARLSSYESLSISWVFVVMNGFLRICVLNLVLIMFASLLRSAEAEMGALINIGDIPSLYLIVLSSLLDVIFFPLFGIFIIQFWEVLIRMVGALLQTPGNVAEKADDIISVYFSANILQIVPILGAPLKGFAGMILMYAGLRKQINASPTLSICVILAPMLFALIFLSIIMLLFLISL